MPRSGANWMSGGKQRGLSELSGHQAVAGSLGRGSAPCIQCCDHTGIEVPVRNQIRGALEFADSLPGCRSEATVRLTGIESQGHQLRLYVQHFFG